MLLFAMVDMWGWPAKKVRFIQNGGD